MLRCLSLKTVDSSSKDFNFIEGTFVQVYKSVLGSIGQSL